jgi:transcription initiation factor IIE alpha subunit
MPKTQKQPTSVPPFDPKQKTKSARVLDLMEREMGATLAELIEATGWQAHTIRAALTGLRKKGHAIERRKRDGLTCYHIPAASV